MPLESIKHRAAEALAKALEEAFDHTAPEVKFEVPPKRELGDLAWPGALPLAKELKTAPRQIAEKINETAKWPEEITRVEIAGPGFLNLYLGSNHRGLRWKQDNRRAHSHQPQQGRPHRPPSQLSAGRHPGPLPA
jgi:arginyl-tRNA synthetase